MVRWKPKDDGTPVLRASHADRDRVADVLRIAAGDGQLTGEELDERLEVALTARTRGELAELTVDLPMGVVVDHLGEQAKETVRIEQKHGGVVVRPVHRTFAQWIRRLPPSPPALGWTGACRSLRGYDGGMVDPVLLERARHLAVDERLELVSALLDSIEGDEGELPPELASLLDQRMAAADAAPSNRSWTEVRADLIKSAR